MLLIHIFICGFSPNPHFNVLHRVASRDDRGDDHGSTDQEARQIAAVGAGCVPSAELANFGIRLPVFFVVIEMVTRDGGQRQCKATSGGGRRKKGERRSGSVVWDRSV